MGVRGPAPAPRNLYLVNGNSARRPIREGEPDAASTPPDRKLAEEFLSADELRYWDITIKQAPWLTESDTFKLIMWCERVASYKRNGKKLWKAADRREFRTLGTELGLDQAGRARMGARPAGNGKQAAAAKYLT
jgi:hypothetical protein